MVVQIPTLTVVFADPCVCIISTRFGSLSPFLSLDVLNSHTYDTYSPLTPWWPVQGIRQLSPDPQSMHGIDGRAQLYMETWSLHSVCEH